MDDEDAELDQLQAACQVAVDIWGYGALLREYCAGGGLPSESGARLASW